jgi:hypothetical protein
MNVPSSKGVRERIEDALREIGTLLIALAPVDGVFSSDSPDTPRKILLIAGIGIIMFVLAIILERGRAGHG